MRRYFSMDRRNKFLKIWKAIIYFKEKNIDQETWQIPTALSTKLDLSQATKSQTTRSKHRESPNYQQQR